MKKIFAFLSLFCLLQAGLFASQAMDSATLLNNPGRYRVIGTQADGVIYSDMNSIQAIQTMDYPNSIENISCTLYVETYASPIDAMTFQNNSLISRINEYTATIYANKRDDSFKIDAQLTNAYTPDGQACDITKNTMRFKNVKDLFINAHRIFMLKSQALHTADPVK